jgi:hypothetical protein
LKNSALQARAERIRLLMEEIGTALGEMEAEIMVAWRDSKPDDADTREMAYRDWRALQRLQRKLEAVLKADRLENVNA